MSTPQILTHMSQKDIPLFATYYFTAEGQSYQGWEFDVVIGDPEDPGAHYPPNLRRQALYLNSLKIDALGWYFNTPTLIECKPNATCGAIGQVLSYQKWYRMNFGIQPAMMIVCQRMSRQIETLCLYDQIAVRRVLPADYLTTQRCIAEVRTKIVDRSKQLLYSALQAQRA